MDIAEEVRQALSDPALVIERMGIQGARKNHQGYMIPCPVHAEKNASCSVRRHPGDGTLSWHCFGCDAGGDVFSLYAAVNGGDVARDFPDIVRQCADLAGVRDDGTPWTPPKSRPMPAPAPEPEYPPSDELRAMWEASISPANHPRASAYLQSRGIDPVKIQLTARVIPDDYDLPDWAIFGDPSAPDRYDWIKAGNVLIFPLVDAHGKIKSFRARNINHGAGLKTAVPLGYAVSGLVLANRNARDALRNDEPLNRVIIVEGEIDLAMESQKSQFVIGIYSGSFSELHAEILSSSEIEYKIDPDIAGLNYCKKISSLIRKARS